MKQQETSFPDNIKILLWDTDLKSLSMKDNAQFIIERILEYGDLTEYKWMKNRFSEEQVNMTLRNSKRLSAKTATFYSLIYNVPAEKILCLKKPFTQKQNRF